MSSDSSGARAGPAGKAAVTGSAMEGLDSSFPLPRRGEVLVSAASSVARGAWCPFDLKRCRGVFTQLVRKVLAALGHAMSSLRAVCPTGADMGTRPCSIGLVFCRLWSTYCASLVFIWVSDSILVRNQSRQICLTKPSQAFAVEGQRLESTALVGSAEAAYCAGCVLLPFPKRAPLAANPKGTAPSESFHRTLMEMFSHWKHGFVVGRHSGARPGSALPS